MQCGKQINFFGGALPFLYSLTCNLAKEVDKTVRNQLRRKRNIAIYIEVEVVFGGQHLSWSTRIYNLRHLENLKIPKDMQ